MIEKSRELEAPGAKGIAVGVAEDEDEIVLVEIDHRQFADVDDVEIGKQLTCLRERVVISDSSGNNCLADHGDSFRVNG